MNVPILKVLVRKDQFSAVQKIIPAHEYPIWIAGWGNENLEIIGKTDERHEIDDFDAEINRLEQSHGADKLKKVFGESYIDAIEVSINRIIEKEKKADGSENTAKSKNRASTETRV